LHQLISAHLNVAEGALDCRRGQDSLGVDQQVVFFRSDALDFLGADKVGHINPQEIHQALDGQVCCLDLGHVQADFAAFIQGNRRQRLERHVSLGGQLSLHHQLVSLGLDADVFDRRVFAGERVVVQNVRQGVGGNGDLRRFHGQGE